MLVLGCGADIYRQIQFVRQVMAMAPERGVQNRNARQDMAVEPIRGVQIKNVRQDCCR
ncbi:hypothetical protein [Bacillus yapensis]|uniref:hypothetical protein n=1 Tax=Bacillus yapensis TaxID=2492960 RepID=UPI001BAF5436|nr:hypothetical protein [Bacillus yapensis]